MSGRLTDKQRKVLDGLSLDVIMDYIQEEYDKDDVLDYYDLDDEFERWIADKDEYVRKDEIDEFLLEELNLEDGVSNHCAILSLKDNIIGERPARPQELIEAITDYISFNYTSSIESYVKD